MNKLLLVISLLIFITVPTVVWSQDCTADDGTEGVELWGECYSIENTTELSLSNSGLTGEIPSEIGNLTNLTYLNLSDNQLTGEIPESICNLVDNGCYIQLESNNLCPPYPECLTDDQIGDQACSEPCSGCNPGATTFSGDECTQWVTDINECNEGDLQVLEDLISQNGIDEGTSWTDYDNGDGTFEPLEMGEQYWVNGRLIRFNPYGNWNNDPVEFSYGLTVIPENIGNLSELRYLDLDNNAIATLPESFGNLSLLDTLWFGRNPLEVIPESIFDLISLNFLAIYYTNISEIPPEIGNLTNLTYLGLWQNELSGSIPPVIGNLTNLTLLSLYDNQLTGEIPSEIGNLTNLKYLSLRENELSGSIPPVIGNLTNLTLLSLYDNQLTGEIPSNIGSLDSLSVLNLEGNQLTGEIPPEIGNLNNLKELRLSSNQLTGEIPSEIGNLTSLRYLQLYDNQLTGSILPEIGNLTDLIELSLWGNQLTGEIPSNIGSLDSLSVLNLQGNQLTGEIPPEIGNLNNLTELMLYSNQLTGLISDFICGIDLYNLVNNSLCGPFPDCIDDDYIFPQENSYDCDEYCNNNTQVDLFGYCYDIDETTEIILNHNQLTGEIPQHVGNLINLEILYLNGNQLTGVIPSGIGLLINLEKLMLHDNELSGEIPSEIGSLTNLERMYLNDNQLSGEIPSEIGFLTNLERMYLNDNALSGFIPETLCDLNINFSSTPRFRIYNNYLCPPYPECLSEDDVGEQDTSNCGEDSVTVDHNSDWNLVGLPLAVYDPHYLTIFPDAVENTLFSFDVTYNLDSVLVNGDGYWLRFDEGGTTTITGAPLTELTITLEEDWNLISGIAETISIYSISDPDGIIVGNTLFGFDQTYISHDELVAGKGYWIRTFEAGDITLTAGAIAKVASQDFSLKANSLSINGLDLYFGVELSDIERLSFSLPPKPPTGAFDVRFKDGWRAVKNYGVVEVMPTTETLTIAYNILLNAGEHHNWVLSSESTDYIIEGTGELVIPSAERFVLNRVPVIPITFTLHQNFPNPFNPITTLRYDLPSDALVTLSIYDMLGREITQLVNNSQEAGFKSVQWNATDSMGRPVSAGVYLYQIQAGEFVQTKKMVLLK